MNRSEPNEGLIAELWEALNDVGFCLRGIQTRSVTPTRYSR
jgi:hypothetical protein